MGSADTVFRWRKSSFSGETGECVELGLAWRKSSRSGHSGSCVELGHAWRKPSLSMGNGECVELAFVGAVRDSKNPGGPMIRVGLHGLLGSVKAGRLDR